MSAVKIEVGKKFVDAKGRVATIKGVLKFNASRPVYCGTIGNETKYWDAHGVSANGRDNLVGEYKEPKFNLEAYLPKSDSYLVGAV